MNNSVRVFAPATVANVGCGFDVFGFAVDAPGDEVVARISKNPGVVITKITGDRGRLPFDPRKNTAGVSVLQFLKKIKEKRGIELELYKKMPLGSGMGSSAASSVAALWAAHILFKGCLTKHELLACAMEGERIACGTAHADNVAPSLFGGFVLIRSYAPLDIVQLNSPKNLFCTLVHPHIEINTHIARAILPQLITFKDAISQWGNIAGLVAGLMKEDFELIRRSLEDHLVEPLRSKLIPRFSQVIEAALAAGALGGSISGSGPSLFALSISFATAAKVGKAMKKAFRVGGLESEVYVSRINNEGPRILK